MAQHEEFKLEDHDGNEHVYDVALHPASEGSEIAIRLYTLAGDPIAELISAFASNEDLSEDDDATELIEDVDMSKVSSNLREALMSLDTTEFIREILSYTDRDGDNLGDKTTFDSAFRGNYGELWEAVFKVIRANGFLRSLSTFTS